MNQKNQRNEVTMCGAKAGGPDIEGINVTKESVIQGVVRRGDQPVSPAYVRLLDDGGEFTAEVPTSATGQFRFFAAPGTWTLRVLAPLAGGEQTVVDHVVVARQGAVADVEVDLSPEALST